MVKSINIESLDPSSFDLPVFAQIELVVVMTAVGNPANELMVLVNDKRVVSKLPTLRNSRGLGCMAGMTSRGPLTRVARRSSGEDEQRPPSRTMSRQSLRAFSI